MRIDKYKDYVKPMLIEIAVWCRNGMTEKELATQLGISVSALKKYKREHKELAKAMAYTRPRADANVEDALFKRAIGYQFEEVTKERVIVTDKYGNPIIDDNGVPKTKMEVTKIVKKEVQGDVGAQQFWLKNRKPDVWRDKKEQELEFKNVPQIILKRGGKGE